MQSSRERVVKPSSESITSMPVGPMLVICPGRTDPSVSRSMNESAIRGDAARTRVARVVVVMFIVGRSEGTLRHLRTIDAIAGVGTTDVVVDPSSPRRLSR